MLELLGFFCDGIVVKGRVGNYLECGIGGRSFKDY